jgi:hypothetical protein
MRYFLPTCFVLALCSMLGFSADPKKDAKKPARTTYDEHVLPILKDKCVGCHNQDKKRGGLILNNFTKVMEGGSSGVAVKPGDPDSSLLYKTMAHTAEPFMPPMQPKLANETLEVVRKWIADGAPENAGSKVVVVNKPKMEISLGSVIKGKPAGPPPMPPATLSREPVVRASRDTAVTALAASPWAPLVAIGGQKQVLLYNTDTLELLGVLPFPEGTPNVIKFSRNSSLLLVGGGRAGKSGKVVLWNVTTGERIFAVGDESDSVLAADISPDQTQIALGGPGKIVRVYSTKDGKLLHEIRKHTEWVTAIEYSPDGVLLSTGDRNGGLFVWEAFNAREFFSLKGHTAAITDISWRLDSNVVASASEDATVRLYEMENGNQIRVWGANGGGSLGVNYSKDGRILSTGRDRVTKLWDGNGTAQRSFEAFGDVGLKAVFSHDAARVIGSDWAGQILVWATGDGKRIGTLSANPPSLAEQLAAAQKIVPEKQKAFDALAAVAKVSGDQLAKMNVDIANASKNVADTTNAFKAAEAKFNQVNTALTNARNAQRNAQHEQAAKESLARNLTDAAAKVKADADKAKDNPAMQAAATRALALSSQAGAELLLAEKTTNDMTAAVRVLEPQFAPAQQAMAPTKAAMDAAPKTLAALQAALPPVQAKATTDKAAMDKALAELNEAKANLAKIEAAAKPPAKK